MNTVTLEACAALIRADESLGETARENILRTLRGPGGGNGMPETRLLRLREAAARLSVSRRTITNLCREGVLRPLRLPGRRRSLGVPAVEIDRLLELRGAGARRRRVG